jgi:hypothetical protein
MYRQLATMCVGRYCSIAEAVDVFCYIAFVLATGKKVVVWYGRRNFGCSYQDRVFNERRIGPRARTMLQYSGFDSR